MAQEHVERISRTLVHKGSILDIYQDEILCPDGSKELWDFVAHRNGAAAVVPALPDGRILLCRQYRPALDRYTWELPAGERDSQTEETIECAKRELTEETGYTSDKWERILSLKSTVAFCNELIDVFLAEDCYKIGEQHLDSAESIDLKIFEQAELLEMIYSGTMQDAKTVAGILAYINKVK